MIRLSENTGLTIEALPGNDREQGPRVEQQLLLDTENGWRGEAEGQGCGN